MTTGFAGAGCCFVAGGAGATGGGVGAAVVDPGVDVGAPVGTSGIGAGFALVGLVVGIQVGRITKSMAQLGAQIQGKPSAEQMQQMGALRKQQATYSNANVVLLILAVIFMAIARYLVF